jgi:hypothetical protein
MISPAITSAVRQMTDVYRSPAGQHRWLGAGSWWGIQVRVLIDADGGDRTVALLGWLRRDPGVTRHATVTGRASADPTAMSALDVIDVVLTHTTGLGTLALALLAWRHSRPSPGPITLTRPDGQTLTINGTVSADLITAFLSGGSGGSGGDQSP